MDVQDRQDGIFSYGTLTETIIDDSFDVFNEQPTGPQNKVIPIVSILYIHANSPPPNTVGGTSVPPPPFQSKTVRLNAEVEHRIEFQPESANELLQIAPYFMPLIDEPSINTTVLGWLTLLSAMIAQRRAHIVRLRSDAREISRPSFA